MHRPQSPLQALTEAVRGEDQDVTGGSPTTVGPEVMGGRQRGRKEPGEPGVSLTHLPVAALVEIVLSGRHAQGGLVYLEAQRG